MTMASSILDGLRPHQPLHGLEHHERRDAQQQHGAGVAAEHFDFPGAEGITPVAGLAPRKRVRERRQAQRQRMRAHVPAVRQHRHGIEPPAAGDLDDHHRGGQPERAPDVGFGQRVAGVETRRPAVMIGGVHPARLLCFIVGPSDTRMMSLPRVCPSRLFSQALAASAIGIDTFDEHLELAGIGQLHHAREHFRVRRARSRSGRTQRIFAAAQAVGVRQARRWTPGCRPRARCRWNARWSPHSRC